jgi:hypothetical protein
MIWSARDCARDLCTCTWTPSPVCGCGGFSVDAEICDTRLDFSGLVKLADNVESRCTVLKRFSLESEFINAAGAGSGLLGAGAGLFPPPLLIVA